MIFKEWLQSQKIPTSSYLKLCRYFAKSSGYNDKDLNFADDGVHKLEYQGVKFGRNFYNDFYIWGWYEFKKEIPTGTADKKRQNYLKRATNIKGNWKEDKNSKNNLAIKILWAG